MKQRRRDSESAAAAEPVSRGEGGGHGDCAGTWSRGMKEKLALARALLHRPPVVILDEPTAGLDVVAAVSIRDDLRALASREGVTIFVTTHNMAEAEKLCDRVAVIRRGKLVAVDHPDRLRARTVAPGVEIVGQEFTEDVLRALRGREEVASAVLENGRLVIGLRTGANTAPLVTLLVNAGAQVEEVLRSKASLEDVFLTLMEEEL
ncbi:MAG: ABC transporter ATP-binding protein [Candidatus Eisenbacteria bacterium]